MLTQGLRYQTGLHVLFLPPIGGDSGIYDLDKEPKKTQGSGWQNGWHAEQYPEPDKNTRQILINNYGVPQWYFRNMGWNANGFFGSTIEPDNEEQAVEEDRRTKKALVYNAYARFLSKEVERKGNDIGYGWTFMSFYFISRLTEKESYAKDNAVILLCFDLPERLCEDVRTVLDDYGTYSSPTDRCFSVLPPVLLHVVMVEFERGLWSFQEPVRSIEKRRNKLLAPPQGEKSDQDKVAQMENGYRDIYELLRHASHMTETLDVASKSLRAAYEESQDLLSVWTKLCGGHEPDQRTISQSLRTLKFSSNLAFNLDRRADSFVERLRNEASIVSSLTSTLLLGQTIKDGQTEAQSDRKLLKSIETLLEQTKNDGAEFAQRISVMTLLLLPATLVAGFFGMNFFTLTEKDEKYVLIVDRKHLGLFFLITVPFTLACLRWGSRAYPMAPEGTSKILSPFRTRKDMNHASRSSSVSSHIGGTASQIDDRTNSGPKELTDASITGSDQPAFEQGNIELDAHPIHRSPPAVDNVNGTVTAQNSTQLDAPLPVLLRH
ncbi:hypothetical protein LTR24_008967 [Lithohypha guttulata]|uniref:Uncharacterized protein n=1 Tax=Lithohypha guttulata TaxID=1690604 RepID=A0ABR0JYB3_9EURO|nr:hypothetical protein LTR24_008967 [Lithohypha guttulata]